MLVFGIDTCCMAATAALMNDKIMVAQTVINQNKTHSQIMMPQIEQMFKAAEVDPASVDAFAAAVGPGSFTGVRIGVATAKALAQAADKPCVAVSTLEALAYSSKYFDGIISPVLDARRNQVYNALFCGDKELVRLTDDRALALEDLFAELKEYRKKVLFMGDATLVFSEEIRAALGDLAYFAPKVSNLNLAGAVAEIGLDKLKKGETTEYGKLVPEYIRLSQAEREKLEREGGLK
jgi:tRNA threonylcarbamoyladenosine biosynthesis protein TsaB